MTACTGITYIAKNRHKLSSSKSRIKQAAAMMQEL